MPILQAPRAPLHRFILPVCTRCRAPAQNLPLKADLNRFEHPRVGSMLCLKCGSRSYFRQADWTVVEWSPETGEFVPRDA